MSTRRSRLQVKPNIGIKLGRGITSGPVASKGSTSGSASKGSTSGPVTSKGSSSDPIANKNSTSVPVSNTTDIKPKREVKNEISSKCIIDPVNEPDIIETRDIKPVDLPTEIKCKITNDPPNELVVTTTECEFVEKKEEESCDVETTIAESKPQLTDNCKDDTKSNKPKFRSRFPKAKPNLVKGGRIESRKIVPVKSKQVPVPEKCIERIEIVNETTSINNHERNTSSLDKDRSDILSLTKSRIPVTVEKCSEVTVTVTDVVIDDITKEDISDDRDEVSEPLKAETNEKPVFEKPARPVVKRRKSSIRKVKELPSMDEPPDRSKMRMIDLIYWNPTANLMKPRQDKKSLEAKKEEKMEVSKKEAESTAAKDEAKTEDVDEPLPVPQVQIGPDGNIMLNEASLVVDNKLNDDLIIEGATVEEDESTVSYKSFREVRPKSCWNEYETKLFYKALSTVGTDFSLMMNLFPKRNRKEIKNKFKKEERYNRQEVDDAIQTRTQFRMADFENVREEFKKEIEAREKEKARLKAEGVKKKRKRKAEKEEEKKENKKLLNKKKKRVRSKRIIESDEDIDEGVDMTPSESEEDRTEETVEILIDMSQGSAKVKDEFDVSDAESETPSEAMSIDSNTSAFVPTHIKSIVKRKCVAVEEDGTVDNLVFDVGPNVEPEGDIGRLLSKQDQTTLTAQEGPRQIIATTNVQSGVHNPVSVKTEQTKSNKTAMKTVPAVSISMDHETLRPTLIDNIEIPEELLPVIDTAGGTDNVQIVLVQDLDPASQQFRVHVYVLPRSAREINLNGTTVILPAKEFNVRENSVGVEPRTNILHQGSVKCEPSAIHASSSEQNSVKCKSVLKCEDKVISVVTPLCSNSVLVPTTIVHQAANAADAKTIQGSK